MVAIAPSGAGKEHPRQCCKKLLTHALLEDYFGSERIGSSAGIVSALDQHPVRLFLIDEIGRLLKTMRDPGNSHLFNIGTVMMKLYSSSGSLFTGGAYADGTKTKKIDQPHMCLYGTTVPTNLFEGLTPDNLTDGFMGRLMFFETEELGEEPDDAPPSLPPPERILQTLNAWSKLPRVGAGNLGGGQPIRLPHTEKGRRRFNGYKKDVRNRLKTDNQLAAGIWSRAAEKAGKLALIHACCLGYESHGIPGLAIGEASVNWGIKLANYNARYILQAAANNVADENLFERNLQRVFKSIGPDGCTATQLANRTRWLKEAERNEFVCALRNIGKISITEIPKKEGHGGFGARFYKPLTSTP